VSAVVERRHVDRSAERRGLWAPFAALLSGQGVAVVLGLVFWLVAARLVSPADLGIASASISTQTLLGLLVSLGLGTHLVTELPNADPHVVRRWVYRALLGAGAVGVVAAGVLLGVLALVGVVAPGPGGALREGLAEPQMIAGFVVGVVAAAGVLVLDETVLGLRRSRVQLTRNVTASLLRFPVGAVLLLVAGAEAWVVQVAWVLPLLVSLLLALRSLRLPTSPPAPWSDDVQRHLRPALRHHAVNLTVAAATQVVPVISGLVLVATDNAAFAVAWLLATCAYLPPYLLATALYAHASHDGPDSAEGGAALAGHLRRTVPVGLGLVLVAWVAVLLLAEPALGVLGDTYAEESADLLVMLVPAGLWMVVKDHLVVVWRRERRYRLATTAAAVSLLLESVGAVVGAVLDGATGLVLGWLTVIAVELLAGAPVLLRRMGLRRRSSLPRRDERGRASWSLVVLLLVSGLVAVSVIVGLAIIGGEPRDQGTDDTTGTAQCVPSPENPGPQLDLTVKVDTGDPDDPFRTVEQIDRLVDAAEGAGADIVSTSLSWRVAQRSEGEAYDFRGLDRVVEAAMERGLEVKVQLLHTTSWGVAPGPASGPWVPPRTEAELARWATFVRGTVSHLAGRARYVEIWSSPDLESRWRTGVDPAEFARLLEVSATAVKSVDPGVQVVSGGLDGNTEYLGAVLDEFSDQQPPFDMLGLHVFGDEGAMIDPQSLYSSSLETLAVRGYDLPVYVTEMGWSTLALPDELRARRTAATLDAITCDTRLEVVSWYALHQTRWDGPRWALLTPALTPTLTYDALAAWSQRRDRAVEDAGEAGAAGEAG
jgi:O-antigen/teichoic acid export membrane protein